MPKNNSQSRQNKVNKKGTKCKSKRLSSKTSNCKSLVFFIPYSVHKIEGTELFSLQENPIEGASRKIAELLDSTLSSETEAGSSTLRKSDLGDFDIGEFV